MGNFGSELKGRVVMAAATFAVSLALGILTTIVTAVTMTRMMIAVWYHYARPTRLPI